MAAASIFGIRRIAAVGGLTTLVSLVAAPGVAHAMPDGCKAAQSGAVSCSVVPTSGLITLVVPKGITRIEVRAAGGAGGTAFGVTGGRGALIHNAALPVTPGDELWIRAGWAGSDAGQDRGRGGSGGALNTGTGGTGGAAGAAGGGGATEILDHTTGVALLIAGGGGGAGGDGDGHGMPLFGGAGGDAGTGGGDGYGKSFGEGGSAPSFGIAKALAGPTGHDGRTGGPGGGGAGGGAGVGGAATGAADAGSSGGGGAGGGSLGAGSASGDSDLSSDREGSLSLSWSTSAAPIAPAAPATQTGSDGQSARGRTELSPNG